jgi:glycosyltransferase involved in cell wall biosynthesis
LLPLAVALRHQCGAHIVYDVHEDYTANAAQRWGTRHWLPEYLRQWQQEALPLLSGVTYAEALYNDVLQARGVVPQVAVVQNAFRPPEQLVTPQPPGELPRLLFTGTLSESWGVFTALDVWHALWNLGLHTELLLVGYSPASGVLRQLEQRIAALQPLPVRLVGGAAYVPHHNVLQYIAGCDAGFALYHPQPNLRGKVPTKFWEYGYYGKPLLYTDVPEWRAYHQSNGLGFAVPVQPSAEDIQQLHHQLRLQFSIPSGQQPAFRQTGYDAWTNNEAPRLLALYRALLGAPKAS